MQQHQPQQQQKQNNNQYQPFTPNKSAAVSYQQQQNPTQFYQYVQQNSQLPPQIALQQVQYYPQQQQHQQQQIFKSTQQQQQQVPVSQIKQLPPQNVQQLQSKTPTSSKQQQFVFGAPQQVSVLGGVQQGAYQQQIVLPRFVQSMIPVETCAILADIGGTNSRFCLKQFTKDTTQVSFDEKDIYTYNTQLQDYESFYAIVDKFFNDVVKKSGLQPTIAVLSFAGPILENTVIISNQPAHWPNEPIKQSQILKQFPQLAKCIFMNDFEAIGYAFSRKDKLELFTVHKGALKTDNKKYPMAVLGPGTGLGEAIINPVPAKNNTQDYHVFPTEGGHATFAPITAEEFEYTEFVKKERSLNYVCNEVAFAGPAIPYIYNFFRKKSHEPNNISHQQNELKNKLENNEISQPDFDAQYNKLIVQTGINDQDPVCYQAMKFLVKILATEIGNFGIRAIARDGVFVVGSLINSLSNFIEKHYDEVFRPVYFNKDKMIHLLEEIPVYIVKTKELGLIGCFNQAQKYAFEN